MQAPGRYGQLKIVNNDVVEFVEKPLGDGSWINGGYFVLEPDVFDYISTDSTVWEKEPLEKLAKENPPREGRVNSMNNTHYDR